MRTSRRRSILALFGCAAVAAVALPLYAVSAPAGTKAPDLRADAVDFPAGLAQPGVYLNVGGIDVRGRLLVRFDGYVTNVGAGPLEIRGNPQLAQSDPAGVKQYAFSATESGTDIPSVAVGAPEVKFEFADSHNHFHLKRAMEYSLWNLTKTAQVAPGQKVGFCLYDSDVAPAPSPPPVANLYNDSVTHFCQSGHPDATSLRMGVGSGRRDVYSSQLAYQWVDVSATSPGTYLVASQADPGNVIWEGDGPNETNTRTFASRQVTVPGYVAKPAIVTQVNGPQVIALGATAFGSPGPRASRIVTPPAHGTLSALTGTSVTYTPAAGYGGPDSFTYAARDQSSDFPTSGSEPTGTVSLLAAQPSVAISGAPQNLIAGTSAQLSATVSGASGGVTWSTTAGTISPTGLLIAPAVPPAGGTLTVRATSTSTPALTAQAVIAITPVPVAQPAPLPGPATPTVAAAASNKLLSRLTVGHAGTRVVVGTVTTGPDAGRVDVIVAFKSKVLGRCGARVGARKTVTCKITLKRSYPLTRVRITARLSILGKSSAVRRAFVVTPG